MPRIAATSDLHFDTNGYLTPPSEVRAVARAMIASGADAIVVAGDIGHPFSNFCRCLDLFSECGVEVGVVAGNHDVWRDEVHDSRSLWDRLLREATRDRGCHWLEGEPLVLGSTAIVGSMVWYDYSAADPSLEATPEFFEKIKPRVSNDAMWIDWTFSDPEMSEALRSNLEGVLESLERDESIDRIVVVTHVPVFESQMLRNPDNEAWSIANAYFGNLKTGKTIAKFSKVRAVISGHLHTDREGIEHRKGLPDIQTRVIGSDYGKPSWIMVDV